MEVSVGIVRAACLFLPALVLLDLCLWLKPSQRQLTGAFLAFLWNLPTLLVLHMLSVHYGWWTFEATGGVLLGMPIDLLLGWSLLWGAIPAVAFPRTSLLLLVVLMVVFDVLFMPILEPVLVLNSSWIWGEILGVIFCLLPSQLLGRWTVSDKCLIGRGTLQVLCFCGLAGFLLPAVICESTGGSISALFDKPLWQSAIYFQLLAWSAVIGISAVQEFVVVGKGTPFPFDPPKRLVTTGLYRYIRNPMQTSMVLVPVILGVWISSYWVMGVGVIAIVYSIGFAKWSEADDLKERFGDTWLKYSQQVKSWYPSLVPKTNDNATLYYAQSCGMCSELAEKLQRLEPIGVNFIPAEFHPLRDLSRSTYELPEDGISDQGIAAVARLLEHVNFPWALLGAFMRLPLISCFLQLVVDSCGGEKRLICRFQITERL